DSNLCVGLIRWRTEQDFLVPSSNFNAILSLVCTMNGTVTGLHQRLGIMSILAFELFIAFGMQAIIFCFRLDGDMDLKVRWFGWFEVSLFGWVCSNLIPCAV
uniref:Uncharacterized protein n=1 Tax=Cyprinodon variegatus TaxID=28743 RepID=A0A3Q2FNH1_CYPVA